MQKNKSITHGHVLTEWPGLAEEKGIHMELRRKLLWIFGIQYWEMILHTLPELAEKLSKKEQYGTWVSADEAALYVDARLQAGERYIASFPDGDKIYIIMEEK